MQVTTANTLTPVTEEQRSVRSKFLETANQYDEVRHPDDLDLVAWVRNELFAAGLGQEVIQGFDTSPTIQTASMKRPEVQRYMLNKFLNLQLMMYASESINERFCLVPNGQLTEWMTLFKNSVLPFLVAKRLPLMIGQ
jgi:hypothetical protein